MLILEQSRRDHGIQIKSQSPAHPRGADRLLRDFLGGDWLRNRTRTPLPGAVRNSTSRLAALDVTRRRNAGGTLCNRRVDRRVEARKGSALEASDARERLTSAARGTPDARRR